MLLHMQCLHTKKTIVIFLRSWWCICFRILRLSKITQNSFWRSSNTYRCFGCYLDCVSKGTWGSKMTLYLKLHCHIHPPFLLYGVTQFYHVPFVIFSTYSGHYCQGGAWWRRNCNWLVRRSCDQPCVPSHLWVASCTFPQEDRCRGQVQRLAKVIS